MKNWPVVNLYILEDSGDQELKILIAVVSCHSRPEFSAAIRSTWLPLVRGADLKFFLGRGAIREPMEDEVFLDCDDSYQGLPNKVQEIVRWAYAHEFDFVMKFDDDTVLLPSKWLSSGFEKSDFTGCLESACKPGEIKTPYGFAYVLSRRAMELVIAAPLPGQLGSTHSGAHNNDEAWISTVLHVNNIFLQPDPRYYLHRGEQQRTKRPLRAPKRPDVFVRSPPADAFAFCMYLNWSGFHKTPHEEILKEFHKFFERYK
jgi:hypothetical protein